MLQGRLMRRLRHLGLQTLEEYREYLFASGEDNHERIHFIDAVTTNKTDFYREPQHFDYLTNTALPNIFSRGKSRHLNIWCAGCSSGEEPYTLAMVTNEFIKREGMADFSILATDISTRVLETARAGIYEESRVEPLPSALRTTYVLRSKNRSKQLVRIAPEMRQRISFYRLNFMDKDYRIKDMYDIIFFRNVMIYFDRPTQEAVLNRMCRNLNPGGYLFAGHSESLTGLNIPIQQVGSAVYRKPL
jgi:chemotaxis protein methyltransferase CheR